MPRKRKEGKIGETEMKSRVRGGRRVRRKRRSKSRRKSGKEELKRKRMEGHMKRKREEYGGEGEGDD